MGFYGTPGYGALVFIVLNCLFVRNYECKHHNKPINQLKPVLKRPDGQFLVLSVRFLIQLTESPDSRMFSHPFFPDGHVRLSLVIASGHGTGINIVQMNGQRSGRRMDF